MNYSTLDGVLCASRDRLRRESPRPPPAAEGETAPKRVRLNKECVPRTGTRPSLICGSWKDCHVAHLSPLVPPLPCWGLGGERPHKPSCGVDSGRRRRAGRAGSASWLFFQLSRPVSVPSLAWEMSVATAAAQHLARPGVSLTLALQVGARLVHCGLAAALHVDARQIEALASAGSAPLSSGNGEGGESRRVIWVSRGCSHFLSFASPPVVVRRRTSPAASGAGRLAPRRRAGCHREEPSSAPPPQGRREGHQPRGPGLDGAWRAQ